MFFYNASMYYHNETFWHLIMLRESFLVRVIILLNVNVILFALHAGVYVIIQSIKLIIYTKNTPHVQ